MYKYLTIPMRTLCLKFRPGISLLTGAVQVSHFFTIRIAQKYGRTSSNPGRKCYQALPSRSQIKKDPVRAFLIWLRDLDSNQDNILQRDVSYH